MIIKTTPFDAAEYLGDAKGQLELINDAFESGDPQFIAHALDTVKRARSLTQRDPDCAMTDCEKEIELARSKTMQFQLIVDAFESGGGEAFEQAIFRVEAARRLVRSGVLELLLDPYWDADPEE